MSGSTITAGRLELMLAELRLPTVRRLAAQVCAQSDREGWPAHRLLEALLEHELAEREQRRLERHRAESGLSPDKRLSGFDFAAVPSVSKAQVMALAEGHEWLERGANVLLFGPPGVGKSHLVCALGHALIDAGRRVLFTRCSDLVQRLRRPSSDQRGGWPIRSWPICLGPLPRAFAASRRDGACRGRVGRCTSPAW